MSEGTRPKGTSHGLRRRLAVGTLALAVAWLAAGCGGDGEKPIIRIYDGQWETLWINNAIATFIIENGYGYPVEAVVATTFVMEERLPQGEIDLNLEGWQHNIPDWYRDEIAKGTIVNLGTTYEGSAQVFIIPQWVAEQYEIRTIFDMQDHWELFRDPQDPSKGVFFNCIIGSQCADVSKVKLEVYGLALYYNPVSPASYAGLEETFARAQERGEPIFGYYWSPSPYIAAYDWYVLEEPTYDADCYQQVVAAANAASPAPGQACAYATLPIDALAYSGLEGKASDVFEIVQKMDVGLEPLNQTLVWAKEQMIEGWEEAGVFYLRNYEERWRLWVTPEAHEEIQIALEAAELTRG